MKITDRILRQLGVSFVAEQAGISEFRLNANSMKILLVPDPSARAVCVVQHVNVGSRHEGAGNTGYSHLLEHMLFKGTPSRNAARGNSYDDLMKRLGGIYNATTSVDRTNYFAKVPSAFLGEYLGHEADRLRNAIITDEDLRTEMPVVVDEFDIGENDPDQVTEKLLNATAFTEHPYKVDTIGSRSEVMQVTAASLKERLYEVYYHPNNVTLILVGGFDVAEALGLIVKHYGNIPPSPRPIPAMYTVEPQQFGERRFVISKPGDLPRVVMAFHVPQADHEDTPAVAALATMLGGTPASRLYRKLVNTGLASAAYSYAREAHDPGLFQVYAKLNPGVKPKTVERIILAEIDRMCNKLVGKAELARTKVQNLAGTVHLRANSLRFAQQLSEQEAVADWRWGANYDAAFDGLTAERIREVAQRYLHADNRTVGYFLPKAAAPAPTPKPEDSTPAPTPEPQQTPTPAPAPGKAKGNTGTASFAEQVKKVVLPNGLTVLLLPTQTESAIGVHLALSAGRSYAPADKRLVSGMVAQMLPMGSKKYSKARIAEMTSEMLVKFGFNESAFRSELATHVVPADMPRFLDLLSDVLVNPLFREDELELLKTSLAAELEEAAIDPGSRATLALRQAFYAQAAAFGAQSIEEQAKLLPTVTVDELRAFHAKFYSPKGAVLALVGKFDTDAMLATLTAKFGAWTGEDVPAPVAVSSGSPAAKAVNINIEGKDNLTILVGLPADISVHSPEYLAAMLANKALGGDTLTSRLGKEIREKRGLTYGITSRFADPTVEGGLWVVSMTTNAGKLSEALPLIRQIVEEYAREGIGEAELEQEREAMINAFALNLDAPVSIASQIAQCELTGRGVATLDTYEARAKAVTKADVDAVIRKCFRIGDAVTVVAGTLPA
jgi:zinc protease